MKFTVGVPIRVLGCGKWCGKVRKGWGFAWRWGCGKAGGEERGAEDEVEGEVWG